MGKSWTAWPEYKKCFTVVNTNEEFFEILQNRPVPQIANVDPEVFYPNFPETLAWHVVMLTEHTPAYTDAARTVPDFSRTSVFCDDTGNINYDYTQIPLPLAFVQAALKGKNEEKK